MARTVGTFRPSDFERLYLRGALFLLTLGLPKEWFQTYFGPEAQGSALVTLVFLAIFGVAAWYLFTDAPYVVKAIRLDPFLAAFALTIVFSYTWSANPSVTARVGMAVCLTIMFGWYLAIRWTLEDVLQVLAEVLIIGTLANLVFLTALPRYGYIYDFNTMQRMMKGIASNKNSLGQMCALSGMTFIIAAQVFPRRKVLYYTALLVNIGMLAGTNSMTSLVSFVTLMLLMFAFRLFRLGREMFGAVVVLIVVATIASTVFMLTAFGSVATSLGRDPTLTGRTELWSIVLEAVRARPIGGYGWGAFWQGFNSPANIVYTRVSWNPPDSHNALLEYLLGVGIVGAAFILLSFFTAFARAIKFVNRTQDKIAFWPVSFLTFILLNSITEHGFVARGSVLALLSMFTVVLANALRTAPRPTRSAARAAAPARRALLDPLPSGAA